MPFSGWFYDGVTFLTARPCITNIYRDTGSGRQKSDPVTLYSHKDISPHISHVEIIKKAPKF